MTREASRPRRLGLAQLRDLCAGLFGVQVVWGLQNVNTSRIFQTLGADVAQLPLLWIAAPITGLLVQPLVGHLSDHRRGRWGRRKPFILVGTLLTAVAMLVMASAATLAAAVVALWLLTAAVNVAMQPFRSLAADAIPPEQRTTGFALQVCFIGAGAVFASALPWTLVNVFGVAGTAAPGSLPPSVSLAFAIGAAALLLSVGWTLLRSREVEQPLGEAEEAAGSATRGAPVDVGASVGWIVAGGAIAIAALLLGLRRETYLLAATVFAYGVLRLVVSLRQRHAGRVAGFLEIVADIAGMPAAMRRLALTQFLTWFALFTMWIYSVPAIAARQFGTRDAASAAYAAAGDWVGVLFAVYDAVAVAAAMSLPWLAGRLGLRGSHAACLAAGAIGLAGLLLIDQPVLLLIPAVGIGLAWASVLATPYIMVADIAPPERVGTYMGIHNMFLVMPQLVAAVTLGALVDHLLGGRPDAMLAIAAGAMTLAAVSALLLTTHAERRSSAMQEFA